MTPTRSTVLVAHPSAELYGSDRVMLESVRSLVDAGWAVTVTVPVVGPLVPEVRAIGADVAVRDTLVLRKALLSAPGALRGLGQALRGVVGGVGLLRSLRPALVLVNTITVPVWVPLARLLSLPVVTHVHEAEGTAPLLLRRILNAPLLLATEVLVNSEFSRGVLRSAFRSLGDRAILVPNAVSGPASTPGAARAHLSGPIRLVYVGRLSERKGVDVAIQAVAVLRDRGVDAELAVVGAVFPGYEWYEEHLQVLVRRLELDDRVRLLGFHADVWPLLAEADVVVVPSRVDEPFGNTAVEAALAARPSVVSDTSGLHEAAGEFSSSVLVDAGDAGAVADAVAAISEAWQQYRRAAVEDAQVAQARHSPEAYGTRIVAIAGALAAAPSAFAGGGRLARSGADEPGR